MATRESGLGTAAAGIFRPTVKDDQPEAAAVDAPPDDAVQGRGGESADETRSARTRRRRVPAGGKTRPRKYSVPDEVHRRVELLALDRGSNASAIVADILDKNLPHFEVKRVQR